MASQICAKESVGYYGTWTLGRSKLHGDMSIAGWAFAARFERYAADPQAFLLGMAANDAAQGFRIIDAGNRRISCRILPATLQAINDTSGQFDLQADLLATPLGYDRFFVADLLLTVLRGPTA
ncbi:MAG: hypothetical protein J7517_09840 [Sphingobium yanoikuyae]|uniref:hypothetical protein n=1 Tax=Sphingobium yanoikuyae TaxID=13690 RepID=UPI001B1D5BEA|nr:hypothetical protein [Sphingobium yanoikuyae]